MMGYVAAQMTAAGKAFSSTLGLEQRLGTISVFGHEISGGYILGVLIGAAVITLVTSLGGFRGVAWTDLFQGLLMAFALLRPAAVRGGAARRLRRPGQRPGSGRPELSHRRRLTDGRGGGRLHHRQSGHRAGLSGHAPRDHPLHGGPRRRAGAPAETDRHALGRHRLLRRRRGRPGRPGDDPRPGRRRARADGALAATAAAGAGRPDARRRDLGDPLHRLVPVAGGRLRGLLRRRREAPWAAVRTTGAAWCSAAGPWPPSACWGCCWR